jgi:hypothetical protein
MAIEPKSHAIRHRVLTAALLNDARSSLSSEWRQVGFQMVFDKASAITHAIAAANAHGPDQSAKRGCLPAPDEQLVARFRASIMCSEKCALLLRLDEVARALRTDPVNVTQLIATKQLASVIIAGQELVPVHELVEFIDDYTSISKRSAL